MLEARIVAHAVGVAKQEEVAARKRPNGGAAGLEGDHAHAARLGIRDKEPLAIRGDAARLGEDGRCGGSVGATLGASPREHADDVTRGIVAPNLMETGHGDIELAAEKTDIPRRIERNGARRARAVKAVAQLARASNGGDPPG